MGSRLAASTLLAACCARPPGRALAAEGAGAWRLEAMGGQLFSSRSRLLSASLAWTAAPAAEVTPEDVAVASISGRYLRAAEMRELGGGRTRTVQSLSNTAALRWSRPVGLDWELKPNLSFSSELLSRGDRERLGAGALDEHRLAFGLEAEAEHGGLQSLQGVSVYGVRHPRYDPAASPLLGLENRVNRRSLDFSAVEYAGGAQAGAWGLRGQVSYRHFVQQVVRSDGKFSGQSRYDVLAALGLSFKGPAWSWDLPGAGDAVQSVLGLGLRAAVLESNQNHFEPALNRFDTGYYDYTELAAGSSVSLAAKRGWTTSLAYEYAVRRYRGRPAELPNGDDAGRALAMRTHSLNGALTRPLGRGLSAKAVASWQWSSSNTRYAGGYRYDYSFGYYFLGLGYAL